MRNRMKETYHRIGEIVVRRRLAPTEAVDEALALQRAELARDGRTRRLGEILVERNVLSRKVIREILEEQRIGRGEKRVLQVDLRGSHGTAIVSLKGRLDRAKEAAAIKIFERLMNRGFSRIVVDCSKLAYLDSYGVSCILKYVDEARARGGDIKFFGLNQDAHLLMERLELTKFIQLFNSEREAIRAHKLPIDDYMSHGALAEYVSGERTRFYHLSYCPPARKIKESDRLYFQSKWHAREGGKVPCKQCRP